MSARLTLILSTAICLAACSTTQESPIYQQSTKYKASNPTSYASNVQTQAPAQIIQASTYQAPAPVTHAASYTRIDHECLNKENTRELIGVGVGGAVGAVAGNKLIGGTEGTVIGALAGGAVGYGIGDKSINCDPIAVPIEQTQPIVSSTYNAQAQYTYASVAQPQSYVAQPTPEVTSTEAPTDAAYGETFGTPGYHAIQAVEAEVAATEANDTIIPVRPRLYVSDSRNQTAGNSLTHEIIEGDTVYSLAKRQCVGVDDIRSLNNLDVNYAIRLGDYLTLPPSQC